MAQGKAPPFPSCQSFKRQAPTLPPGPKPLQSVKFCCPLLGGAVVSPRSSGFHLVAYGRHKTQAGTWDAYHEQQGCQAADN